VGHHTEAFVGIERQNRVMQSQLPMAAVAASAVSRGVPATEQRSESSWPSCSEIP